MSDWHNYTPEQVELIGKLFRNSERDTIESVGEITIGLLESAGIELVFPSNKTRAEVLDHHAKRLRETANILESMAIASTKSDFGHEVVWSRQ